ncbi:rhodanese-like domain-containing protein [Anaerolineales bacterium HSG25]|nr:rhodanese-like domain-containing protein [Anaerolineales bacterium HSG25]
MLKKTLYIVTILAMLSMALTSVILAGSDVQMSADTYFSGGTKNIAAADLFDNLNDGDSSNDPFVIDVRNAEDYALAHVPDAVNMSVKTMFSADELANIPADTPVVVYCYTGQTSSQAVSTLNMLGYEAQSMKFGFPAWANIDGLTGSVPFSVAVDQHDYRVSTDAVEATEMYDAPTPLGDTVVASAEAYYMNGTKNIKSSALFDNLNDGDTSNDPFMIDLRSAEDYAISHIPGAVNMSVKTMFTEESLATIPTDGQVVVNCYTGQTASQATSALNELGYDATNLKFGFASWSPDGKYAFNAIESPNYRFDGTGTVVEESAMMEEAAPAEETTVDVQMSADTYFSGGTKNIAAADLFDNLNDGDSSNDPFVIDVRNAEDYALAHVPDAVNMSVKTMFSADELANIPADTPVVVYCYTGQTSSQAVSTLNMLGYEAQSMKFGFPAWANIDGLTGSVPFSVAVDQHDYRVSTDAVEATETYDAPTPLGDTVVTSAEAYYMNGTKNIKSSALFDNLNDGDTSNDPFMIDLRSAEDYAVSHIPGAVNMSVKTMFTEESLATIPTDGQVVVNCYTGQTASQATSALNELGYDATNLKFGFASWSPDGKYAFNAIESPNYRFDGTGTVVEESAMMEATAEETATEEAAPAEETTMMEETAPAEETTMMEEAAPAEETTMMEETAPAEETTMMEETAPAEETAPMMEETITEMPATGGVPFDPTWIYMLIGSGLLGSGVYLRRR